MLDTNIMFYVNLSKHDKNSMDVLCHLVMFWDQETSGQERAVSCVTSPGQSWLLIGQSDTIQPSHWLSPADGDSDDLMIGGSLMYNCTTMRSPL